MFAVVLPDGMLCSLALLSFVVPSVLFFVETGWLVCERLNGRGLGKRTPHRRSHSLSTAQHRSHNCSQPIVARILCRIVSRRTFIHFLLMQSRMLRSTCAWKSTAHHLDLDSDSSIGLFSASQVNRWRLLVCEGCCGVGRKHKATSPGFTCFPRGAQMFVIAAEQN